MSDFSEKAKTTHVAYIHETVGESIARDLGTVAVFIVLWSFGGFMGSAALEWVGAMFGVIFVFGRAISMVKGKVDNRMTPEEARAWLDERFPQQEATR